MSGIWSGDTRCVVMLGFDIDGVSSAINRDPKSANLPSLMSMREYGPSVATPRILDLLERYDIFASFYIPGYVAETHTDLVRDIHARGHEVAHHGYMHEPPATLTRAEEAEVLDSGMEILAGLTGETPVGYRSPSWELSEHSLELLADRDFIYDSSLMGDDIPYMVQRMLMTALLSRFPFTGNSMTRPYFSYAPSLGARFPMADGPEPRLRCMVVRIRGRLPLRTRFRSYDAPPRNRSSPEGCECSNALSGTFRNFQVSNSPGPLMWPDGGPRTHPMDRPALTIAALIPTEGELESFVSAMESLGCHGSPRQIGRNTMSLLLER